MNHNRTNTNTRASLLLGALVAGIGIAVALLVYLQPEQLAAPMWVAMLACLCFVFAGAAMSIRPTSSPVLHQCMVLAILLAMTAIPAWISLGPGERQCTSNLPFFNGGSSCRVVFGISTLLMLLVLGFAGRQLWQLLRNKFRVKTSVAN